MKLLNLISSSDHLKWVQGVEANLLRRRQIGDQGGIIVMILGGLLQIWIFLFGEMSGEKVLGNLSAFVEYSHKKVTGASTKIFILAYDLIAVMSGIFLEHYRIRENRVFQFCPSRSGTESETSAYLRIVGEACKIVWD